MNTKYRTFIGSAALLLLPASASQTPAPPTQDDCQTDANCLCDYDQSVVVGADETCPVPFTGISFEHSDGPGFNGCCTEGSCATLRSCIANTSFTVNASSSIQICIQPPGGERTCTTGTSMTQEVSFNEACGGSKTYKVWVGGEQCKNVVFKCNNCTE